MIIELGSFARWLDKEDVVHGPWVYHAKQNKSDRKSQEPYYFTHMWDVTLKATNEPNLIDTDNSTVVTGTKGVG